jgi:hypothetical protein
MQQRDLVALMAATIYATRTAAMAATLARADADAVLLSVAIAAVREAEMVLEAVRAGSPA